MYSCRALAPQTQPNPSQNIPNYSLGLTLKLWGTASTLLITFEHEGTLHIAVVVGTIRNRKEIQPDRLASKNLMGHHHQTTPHHPTTHPTHNF